MIDISADDAVARNISSVRLAFSLEAVSINGHSIGQQQALRCIHTYSAQNLRKVITFNQSHWPVSCERDSFAKGFFSPFAKEKNRAAWLESE
jgi:pimeloyl-ACP methyl ester carboxylesterase